MSYPGTLHEYIKGKVAFEFCPSGSKKTIIFIGGLGDGLLTVPYVPLLARHLENKGWSVVQIQLSSSFKGFGISSLDQDIKEISALVEYLRSNEGGSREKIMLFGHSTGSQDTIHYLLNNGSTVDAGILQASVSDREAPLEMDEQTKQRLDRKAKEMVARGQKNELLSAEHAKYSFNAPITAYRWCSLFLPGGDDDYFSSDLTSDDLKSTFGQITKPFLIAYGEKDEYTPTYVDKKKLLDAWKSCSNPEYWSKNSGLIEGADHRVSPEASRRCLFSMVDNFLEEFNL
ncbi:LAFE_0G08966g1_1 [Lachancea fermentati]|uniref:LAFE_0G08966g1_1 n=1 Tax=Lachancea fermentati TaxID=4955 RepID=A0A1G4MHQ3_LACFM|nr:LAFE_0G08966g1_1 [Lachancea fermentati]